MFEASLFWLSDREARTGACPSVRELRPPEGAEVPVTGWRGEGQLNFTANMIQSRELKDQSGPEEGWEAAKTWG